MRSSLVALAATLALAGAARAEEPAAKLSAAEILAKMDATNNAFADQIMDERLTVVDVDGSKKSYDMTVNQKGEDKRYIVFTSGELKGMATLVEDRNNVHVYLPGFKKVRRVAAHNMNQALAGSDTTNEDMATTAWAKGWVPTYDKEDETSYWLTLNPKPDTKTEYARVAMRVDKATFCQAETQYFNKAGEMVKRMQSEGMTDWGNKLMRFKQVTFSDPRTGHKTILEMKAFKVNVGLKDDMFTVRQLQWNK